MPALSVTTTPTSWGGKNNRISLTFFNESSTATVYIMIDRAEGRTLSSSDNDGAIFPLSFININLLEDGDDVKRGYVLVSSAGTVTVGITEFFGTGTVRAW